MQRVAISNVQQVNDRAFFQRKGKWLDSRIAHQKGEVTPKRKVSFASREYFDIAGKLAAENRQATMALPGDIVLVVDGEPVLIEGAKDGN